MGMKEDEMSDEDQQLLFDIGRRHEGGDEAALHEEEQSTLQRSA